MVPSVVMTIPIVEWSLITFSVPIDAASLKGIASLNHREPWKWYPTG